MEGRLASALILALAAAACGGGGERNPVSEEGDLSEEGGPGDGTDALGEGEADPPMDDGPGEGEEEQEVEEEAVPCTEPEAGMIVTVDTTLCRGTYTLDVRTGDAAVTVDADGVTLTCDATVIENAAGSYGKGYGFKVEDRSNVTIQGCTARSFRYGLYALRAGAITLRDMHLDDNFTDPEAGWVQDTVQGGGIRLEGVDQGIVEESTFARNWNGIELRDSTEVHVRGNVADHCSNTGALVVGSNYNELSDNDFSWAIRGEGLSYPDSWYGVDTRDSAGIIIDALSYAIHIVGNDFRYGGDGVFIRSVIGQCAVGNTIEGNDASFSPHNAIECWCDGNDFIDNVASDSHYGLWLGGTDLAVVRGNTVERSVVDGISIQIGENRHTLIEGNTIRGSGRAGLLITGRQYQAWQSLSYWDPSLANSSHVIVQGNTFENNFRGDVFVTSTRGIVFASNCGDGGGEPLLRLEREAEVTRQIGTCGGAVGRTAPAVRFRCDEDPPPSARAGDPVTLEVCYANPSPAGGTLSYFWLIQPSGMKFPSGTLPPFVFGGEGSETQTVTFSDPGLYDIDVTVDDGHLAALSWEQFGVLPEGTRVGETIEEWDYSCSEYPACDTTIKHDKGLSGNSIYVVTDAPYDFAVFTPATRDLGFDASSFGGLAFFIFPINTNSGGWQGNFPIVVVGGSGGEIRYAPDANLLSTVSPEWVYVDIPAAGGEGWTRSVTGSEPSTIDYIEIHADTLGSDYYGLGIDALTLVE